ncbi:hypothetical protein [Actinoplanes flavus]|uniref:Uncharacterized protein n=1 Tax=Actinoplanes flavus TaxID=2820290 RepID=A0ABS3UD10_9ACTN|nr:hypothetical protein [Actinoplanes flavus]MBO3736662.1 hypothetical protein [Actinoplanes flavus]
MTVRITDLPYRCGTCLHVHPPLGTCADCGDDGCLGWTLHADEQSRLDDRALQELTELQGERTILDAAQADTLLRTLEHWEADHATYGWGNKPLLAVIGTTPHLPVDPIHARQLYVLQQLDLPDTFWHQGHPTDVLYALGGQAAARPGWWRHWRITAGLDPRQPQIAWALLSESYIKDPAETRSANRHPGARKDEMRMVVAVDVDARIYTYGRTRSDGQTLINTVETLPGYQQMRRIGATARGQDFDAMTDGPGLDYGHQVIARLMALQRAENFERARRKAQKT